MVKLIKKKTFFRNDDPFVMNYVSSSATFFRNIPQLTINLIGSSVTNGTGSATFDNPIPEDEFKPIPDPTDPTDPTDPVVTICIDCIDPPPGTKPIGPILVDPSGSYYPPIDLPETGSVIINGKYKWFFEGYFEPTVDFDESKIPYGPAFFQHQNLLFSEAHPEYYESLPSNNQLEYLKNYTKYVTDAQDQNASGDVFVLGKHYYNYFKGGVWVWEYNSISDQWIERKLPDPPGLDFYQSFGASVAININGDMIAVSAPRSREVYAGDNIGYSDYPYVDTWPILYSSIQGGLNDTDGPYLIYKGDNVFIDLRYLWHDNSYSPTYSLLLPTGPGDSRGVNEAKYIAQTRYCTSSNPRTSEMSTATPSWNLFNIRSRWSSDGKFFVSKKLEQILIEHPSSWSDVWDNGAPQYITPRDYWLTTESQKRQKVFIYKKSYDGGFDNPVWTLHQVFDFDKLENIAMDLPLNPIEGYTVPNGMVLGNGYNDNNFYFSYDNKLYINFSSISVSSTPSVTIDDCSSIYDHNYSLTKFAKEYEIIGNDYQYSKDLTFEELNQIIDKEDKYSIKTKFEMSAKDVNDEFPFPRIYEQDTIYGLLDTIYGLIPGIELFNNNLFTDTIQHITYLEPPIPWQQRYYESYLAPWGTLSYSSVDLEYKVYENEKIQFKNVLQPRYITNAMYLGTTSIEYAGPIDPALTLAGFEYSRFDDKYYWGTPGTMESFNNSNNLFLLRDHMFMKKETENLKAKTNLFVIRTPDPLYASYRTQTAPYPDYDVDHRYGLHEEKSIKEQSSGLPVAPSAMWFVHIDNLLDSDQYFPLINATVFTISFTTEMKTDSRNFWIVGNYYSGPNANLTADYSTTFNGPDFTINDPYGYKICPSFDIEKPESKSYSIYSYGNDTFTVTHRHTLGTNALASCLAASNNKIINEFKLENYAPPPFGYSGQQEAEENFSFFATANFWKRLGSGQITKVELEYNPLGVLTWKNGSPTSWKSAGYQVWLGVQCSIYPSLASFADTSQPSPGHAGNPTTLGGFEDVPKWGIPKFKHAIYKKKLVI